MVDKNQNGQLLNRIKGVRKKLSQELGFLIHSVHIRDNLDLAPNSYRITLNGVPVGESNIHPDREMAINPGQVYGELQGIPGNDPAYGLDAVWIEPSMRDHAQTLGYTVVDATTVVATHLNQILYDNAEELLGHEEVQQLLDNLATKSPKLVEDLVPKLLPLSVIVKVMQNLLSEGVSVCDVRTIAEVLAENGGATQNPIELTAIVRVALGRSIVQKINGMDADLPVITLESSLEQLLLQSAQNASQGSIGVEPGLTERMFKSLEKVAEQQEMSNQPVILVVAPTLRLWLSQLVKHTIVGMNVLSYTEIPDNKNIKVVASVGAD
ncbi:Flagellar biosynthesis protein FlhA [hydrothermal vent metagenome]|uniref:Flagellar biosynthesis protein FlhA n=1 Tax=hydrothermal vent metagenome TaxID=652676 RepID=A0A3B0WW49_9ZZZZ